MKIYEKMKTSLVITLKNEESAILKLLGSIVMQLINIHTTR